MKNLIIIILLPILAIACQHSKDIPVTFMVADPGHFHAPLVLKSMYEGVSPKVFVYAPDGPELKDFETRVEGYQKRAENPTNWELTEYRGPDFINRMIAEKPGNVLILAGNNGKKTDYILTAIQHGINVFADKPMAINTEDFTQLESAFSEAGKRGVLLYDIMTERFEISSILQKELSHIPEVFGVLQTGTPENPAVTKESVHHFFKYVSGTRLIRPGWFYDVEQEGEGIVDVTTHLIDLVQWACFPEQVIDYKKDIQISSARHWTTDIKPAQYRESTGLPGYPDYLLPSVNADSILQVYSNGEINYQLKGVNVRVSVIWNYQPPEGGGDTHFSVMRGSLARLEIRQGADQKFKPELYIFPEKTGPEFSAALGKAIGKLAGKYTGIAVEPIPDGYHILIPDALRVGHESHFAQVTRNYLNYLKNGKLPDWEVPNMLAKYWLTTTAREISNK
ncbi:MAG: putative oxidoreductase C-terminal domain-containing protein [Bacteroidales bacterium]|nr:putative oxidoreductase C-terminal domain-containing protein [Bacteroidales bacterium]